MFTFLRGPSFVAPLAVPVTSCPVFLTSLRPPKVLQRAARPARRLSPSVMNPSATTVPAPAEARTGAGRARVATDVIVFIHGITIDADPASETENRLRGYRDLYDKIREKLKGTPKEEQWGKATRVGVQWGFESTDELGNPLRGDHTLLGKAERFAVLRTGAIEEEHFSFTINPLKVITRDIRTPLRFGISDMFFYVSRGGRPLVRKAVARQIMNTRVNDLVKKGEPIELTLLGHSAGSVVAHDFAFFLQDAKSMPAEQSKAAVSSFADDDESLAADLTALINHARQGKLKLRKLVTFGSPLHMLFIRSRPVLKILANEKGVDPAIYGLKEPCESSSNPRWINVVEADDIIAGPVTGLIDENANSVGGERVVEDIYLQITHSLRQAHGSYWRSDDFAQVIAENW